MKKIIYWLLLIATITFLGAFIYHFFFISCKDIGHYIIIFMGAFASFILMIMFKSRPMDTREEIIHNDLVELKGVTSLLIIALICVLMLAFLSGCSHNGYGCHGDSRTMTGEGIKKHNIRRSY